MTVVVEHIHSFVAYIFLLMATISVIYSVFSMFGQKKYSDTIFTLAKIAFIASHIQLLVGIFYWVMLGGPDAMSDVGSVMKNAPMRRLFVEHPTTNIIGILLVSIGYIKIKKAELNTQKLKYNIAFYGIALLLIFSMIPWVKWFNIPQ